MSKNVQNVTLSMTLPISCQICFGKVRKPMICCNLHIFCAACIELWLKKCSQCPTCRVAITAENPCREITGATNESESKESHVFKRHLRKTRGELLLQEYEDELETLLKDNEELKSKNESLESQLKASLKPTAAPVPSSDPPPDSALLGEMANKLQAATELYQKLQEDMTKLNDVNKTLRSQNVHLVQENLRLRAEVESRSPQKFGRFTVAALESKISQYEREVTQLKKALERSDAYIEELESQSEKRQRVPPSQSVPSEQTADCRRSKPDSSATDPSDSHVPPSDEASGSQKDMVVNFAMPSTPPTPSSVLSRLSLKSPVPRSEKKTGFNRLPYLRRLSFDDCSSSSIFPAFLSVEKASPKVTSNGFDQETLANSANQQSVWSRWEEPGFSTGESQQTFSEVDPLAEDAEMNAAFLNIVSELHCMLSEGDSSRSQVLQVPSDLHAEAVEPESTGEQQQQKQQKQKQKQQQKQQQQARATEATEATGESVKRKCATTLATSSPSKLCKTK